MRALPARRRRRKLKNAGGKLEKARTLGVPVIGEDEFAAMLKEE